MRVTKKHLAVQDLAAEKYAAARGLFLERAPGGKVANVDYVARATSRYGEPVIEVLEFKHRSCGITSFADVWAEDRKVHSLAKWGAMYDCPAYFVVEWEDGEMRRIHVEDLRKAAGAPSIKRRIDRNDPNDTDLVWCVPISAMERV